MATKRSPTKGQSTSNKASKPSWKKQSLPYTLVLLAIGLILIFGVLANIILWDSPLQQILVGGVCVLASFVILNILQEKWTLVAGWLLLAPTIWLLSRPEESWTQVLGYLLAGLTLYLLSKGVLRQVWQRQK